MIVPQPEIAQQLDAVVVDLTNEFGERLGRERVREQVMAAYDRLSRARIKTFIPVLTRKIARDSLRHL
jgi:hypothetical protein